MHLFYTPDLTAENYTLNEEESKHCVRVLRLRTGDQISLIDGKGGWYQAEITTDHPKKCEVKVISRKNEVGKHSYQLHLAIAPTKNIDRLEWFAEKSTEIGIDELSLLNCQHSERMIVKQERLEKVLISAMKQSMKAYLPKLNEVIAFKKFIDNNASLKGMKFIAHCHSAVKEGTKPHLKNIYKPDQPALILIGPEGDFSKEEVAYAVKNGFEEVSLGNSRLRTETAALTACLTIHILNS